MWVTSIEIRKVEKLLYSSPLEWLKEVHGDRNATYKNLGTWAGHVMLLYCVCTGDEHIFFDSGTFYFINCFFDIFLKIKGEGLNDKKICLLASLYIRKFKKNRHFFWVYYIQRKKRREGRKVLLSKIGRNFLPQTQA